MFRHKAYIAAAAASLAFASGAGIAQDGVSKDTILIGQSASFTGAGALIGNGVREGALAQFAAVNRAGGVHGRQIVLESMDDGWTAEKAVANTRALVAQKKVFALFGYVGGPASLAALPVAAEAKVPFIGPVNGNEALRDPFNRYAFNVRSGFGDELVYVIDHLTTVGMKRIGVFYADDGAGRRMLVTAVQELKKRNLSPALLPYERNAVEFPKLIPMVAKDDLQAVVMVGAPGTAAAFVREVKKANLNPQFIGLSAIEATQLVKEIGDQAHGVGITQVVPLPTSATLPIVSEYQKAMVQAGIKTFSHASLEGYVCAKVVVEALRKAGPKLTRERFVAAMEGLTNYDLGGMTVSFSPTKHSSATFVELTVVGRNGAVMR